MEKIISIKRYIDDGAGTWIGTQEDFESWLGEVNYQYQI